MDFNFSEEQQMIRDTIERFVREEYDFETRTAILNSDAGWRQDYWEKFAELGLLAAPFSEEDGGLGGNAVDSMLIMEEFGKGLVIEPYVPSVVCAGGFLKHAGSAGQKEEHLAGIMSGEQIFAYAYAEPQGRYNLAEVRTTAKAEGGGYVLNGHKSVVIGAPYATHLIVTARTAGGVRDADGLSVFIVPKNADGITTRDYPTVDGFRASEVYFENVSVGANALIGDADAALPVIEKVADEAIAALCAEAVGAMKTAHQMTLDYTRQRKQFGVPIASFQVLQHRMVDMYVAYEQSTSMTYMVTLHLGEDDVERQKAASAAKVQIGKAGRLVGQEAVQMHGGMGMTDELAVGHYFKRLSIIENQFGNTDFHMRRYTALNSAQAA